LFHAKNAKILKSVALDSISHSRIVASAIEWLRRHLDNLRVLRVKQNGATPQPCATVKISLILQCKPITKARRNACKFTVVSLFFL
jgi:hypothetical protein